MTKKLTQSMEDYLEAISELIAVNGHAHTKEIADKLHVKMPSVTGALRQLVKMNYIVYSTHYPVELTPEGKAVADQVVKRHKVLKSFFTRLLGMTAAEASETACHLEHAVDEKVLAKFSLFQQAITTRSDCAGLRTYLAEAMAMLESEEFAGAVTLEQIDAGAVVKIIKCPSSLPEKLQSLLAGTPKAVLESISLDHRTYRLRIADDTISLDRAQAENIWVIPC